MPGLSPVRAISRLDGASRFKRKALTIRAMSLTNLAIACQAVYRCVIGAHDVIGRSADQNTHDYWIREKIRSTLAYICAVTGPTNSAVQASPVVNKRS